MCYFWRTKRNYRMMLFMSKQVSLPKISSILQKVKISQKFDIRPICTKPFNYPGSHLVLSEPFPVSNWTFPLKLNSRGNRKQEFPVGFDVQANSTGANLPGGEIGSYQRVATSLSSLLKVVTCDQEFFYLPMFAPKTLPGCTFMVVTT